MMKVNGWKNNLLYLLLGAMVAATGGSVMLGPAAQANEERSRKNEDRIEQIQERLGTLVTKQDLATLKADLLRELGK